MRGIHFIAAVGGTGSNDAHRRRRCFHNADLHARGVRAQEAAIGKIKGVLLVARGMVRRRVESIETMPLGLDVGSIGNRKPHAAETPHGTVHELRERMQCAVRRKCAGQREIERSKSGEVGCFEKALLGVFQSGRDRSAQVVEKLPDNGTLILWHIAHALAERSDGTAFAKIFQTGRLEGSGIMGGSDELKGFAAKGVNLLLHGKEV